MSRESEGLNVPEPGFAKTIAEIELPPGALRTVEVNGESVTLANVDGEFYGIGGICKHEEWDLSEGLLDGTTITCAGHGAIWNLKTGIAEFDDQLPPEPLYDVLREGGFLFVRKR
jgi:nitrite reductase/ring-hydroxylating ferredoxin subunit